MDVEVDHYVILGLPTGEEGAKLSENEIKKAYRSKALVLHPDKKPDDQDAHEKFQRLKTSYEILKDNKARMVFDDLLRVKREKLMRQSQQNSKRRKMMSDLEEKERAAFASDSTANARDEEERIARKLRAEIAGIRAMHANKATPTASTVKKGSAKAKESTSGSQGGSDKEKVLKVSWDRIGEDYSAQRLRELFQEFGEVEDVVIRTSTKKKGSALVVMASKDALVTATRTVLGDLRNPLLVLPLQPAVAAAFPSAQQPVQSETPELSNLVGARYQAYEDSVLAKLRKV